MLLGLRLQNGWLEGLLLLNRLLRLVGGHMHSRVEDRQRLLMLQLSLLLDSSDFELLLPQLILLVHQLELLVGQLLFDADVSRVHWVHQAELVVVVLLTMEVVMM